MDTKPEREAPIIRPEAPRPQLSGCIHCGANYYNYTYGEISCLKCKKPLAFRMPDLTWKILEKTDGKT